MCTIGYKVLRCLGVIQSAMKKSWTDAVVFPVAGVVAGVVTVVAVVKAFVFPLEYFLLTDSKAKWSSKMN